MPFQWPCKQITAMATCQEGWTQALKLLLHLKEEIWSLQSIVLQVLLIVLLLASFIDNVHLAQSLAICCSCQVICFALTLSSSCLLSLVFTDMALECQSCIDNAEVVFIILKRMSMSQLICKSVSILTFMYKRLQGLLGTQCKQQELPLVMLWATCLEEAAPLPQPQLPLHRLVMLEACCLYQQALLSAQQVQQERHCTFDLKVKGMCSAALLTWGRLANNHHPVRCSFQQLPSVVLNEDSICRFLNLARLNNLYRRLEFFHVR